MSEQHPSVPGNIRAIEKRAGGGKKLAELINRYPLDILESNESPDRKRDRFTVMLKKIDDVVSPSAPCKKGCSYCCNMAVAIHKQEALLISMAHGIPMEEPEYSIERMQTSRDRYVKVPCVFLKDHQCSIYDVRPVACRLYYNISTEVQLCNLEHLQDVPSLDFGAIHLAAVAMWGTSEFADIREWFPKGLYK